MRCYISSSLKDDGMGLPLKQPKVIIDHITFKKMGVLKKLASKSGLYSKEVGFNPFSSSRFHFWFHEDGYIRPTLAAMLHFGSNYPRLKQAKTQV
ncbi:hypothetical protein GX48_08128 [Paracoccidioides brasiliensis]|nr:hypothetical protein GX48_08128 [Paracoccidioides brasiliensis]